jgi:hypothetical protein
MNEINNNDNKLKCRSCYYFFWILLLLVISYPVTIGITHYYQKKALKEFFDQIVNKKIYQLEEKIQRLGQGNYGSQSSWGHSFHRPLPTFNDNLPNFSPPHNTPQNFVVYNEERENFYQKKDPLSKNDNEENDEEEY